MQNSGTNLQPTGHTSLKILREVIAEASQLDLFGRLDVIWFILRLYVRRKIQKLLPIKSIRVHHKNAIHVPIAITRTADWTIEILNVILLTLIGLLGLLLYGP